MFIKQLCFFSFVFLLSSCDLSLKELIEPSPFEANIGSLSSDEIQFFASKMRESLGDDIADCMIKEASFRASQLGDPETLDPTTVELLPADGWDDLDKPSKRLILTQVVFNQTLKPCTMVKDTR